MANLNRNILISFILLILGCNFFKFGCSQNPLPEIVFVHGMGHGAWAWFEVANLLEKQGYTVRSIDLTSHGIDKAIAADVTTLEEYTKPLTDYLNTIDATTKVVLVGHSLGGGSISYAAEKFATKIHNMIFLAAIMPKDGQSYFDSFPATLFPRLSGAGYLIVNNDATGSPVSVSVNADKIGEFFYNKCLPEFIILGQSLLVPTPYRPANEKLTLTAENYGSIPRYYIRTSNDLGINSADQDNIIAANPPTEINSLDNSDHAAYFSNPFGLASLIMGFAAK